MSEQNELGIAQLELQAAEAKLMRRYREGKLRLRFAEGRRSGQIMIRRFIGLNAAAYFVFSKSGYCTDLRLLR